MAKNTICALVASLAIAAATAGCSSPRDYGFTPVKGLVPYVLSGGNPGRLCEHYATEHLPPYKGQPPGIELAETHF